MKLRYDIFRGIRPRQSKRSLPPGFGQKAQNVRALSDDLESWNAPAVDRELPKAGPIQSLFLLARQFWLHWAEDVDVARGPIAVESAEDERVYFTGLDCPRVTTTSLATTDGVSEEYPYNSIPLGMPAPENAPEAVSVVDVETEEVLSDDASSLEGWEVRGDVESDSIDGVEVDMDNGDPAPSFLLRSSGNQVSTIQIARELPDSNAVRFVIRFKFFKIEGSPTCTVLADEDGNGVQLTLGINHQSDEWIDAVVTLDRIGFNEFNIKLEESSTAGDTSTVFDQPKARSGNWFLFSIQSDFVFGGADPQANGVLAQQVRFDEFIVETGGDSRDSAATVYVYTYLNQLFEESAPSLASDTVLISEDYETTITIPEGSPAGDKHEASGYRLYRAATGQSTTAFLLVEQVLYATSGAPTPEELTYVDQKPDADLEDLLESEDWDQPPEDGHSILALPNGVTAMASRNLVVPSVRFRPHAYPAGFRLPTDYNIVALSALDSTLFALTESHPYQVIGSNPASLSMAKFPQAYACASKRSVANLSGYGVLYASPDGLIVVNTRGARIISEPWIKKREWRELFAPETIVAAAHDDIYFGFYTLEGEQRGFAFDPDPEGFGFTTLDFGADGVYVDPLTDTLYFTQGQTLLRWEGSSERLRYVWRSRLELFPYPRSFQVAQVEAEDYDDVTLRLFGNNKQVFERTVTGPEAFKVPCCVIRDSEIEIEGSSRVHTVELASDVYELS